MEQIATAVQSNKIKEIKNTIPQMTTEILGETLRLIALKYDISNKHDKQYRKKWYPVINALLKAGAPVGGLPAHPEWSALGYALDTDNGLLLRALLNHKPALKNALQKIFGYSVCKHSFHCLRVLLQNDFASTININAPILNGANALALTLLPELWGQNPVLKNNPRHRRASIDQKRFIIAELLLKSGANPDYPQPALSWPLLCEVTMRGMDAVATLLLRFNANPNPTFEYKKKQGSLLCIALRKHCRRLRKALTARPIDFKYITPDGSNLAHVAAKRNAFELLPILKANGVDICANGPLGSIVKFATGRKMEIFEKVVALCEQDKRPVANFQTLDGWAPLHDAVLSENLQQTDILLTRLHANPNVQSKDGITPVMLAAGKGDIKMLRLLKMHGADLTLTNTHGRNALFYTIKGDHFKAFCWLVKHGLNPRDPDINHITLLHEATKHGASTILTALFPRMNNLFAQDNRGQTPLDLLRPRDEKTIVAWQRVAPRATNDALQRARSFTPKHVTDSPIVKRDNHRRQRGAD